MVSLSGPPTAFEKLQAELKRKAAQLDSADNKIIQLTNELAKEREEKAELAVAHRKSKPQVTELTAQVAQLQALLKQRDAAVGSLTQALDAARTRHGHSNGAAALPAATIMPRGPLSRQNGDEGALVAEVNAKTAQIKQLEAELAEARGKMADLTPRRISRRESVEESGLAVVGGGGLPAFEANRLRQLKTEAESWRDRSDSLMEQLRELQRKMAASEVDKAALAEKAAALGERNATLEEQLRLAREAASAQRALSDQGRGDLKSELQRRDSDLARMASQRDMQAALVDELRTQLEKAGQEREHQVLQAQQLQAQLTKAGEEARASNLKVAQLVQELEAKSQALAAAEAEVRVVSDSRFSREAFVSDLQVRMRDAAREKADVEVQLRKVSEQLVVAMDAKDAVEAQVAAARERAEAAETALATFKQQLAEAKREAETHQRKYTEVMAVLDAKEHQLDLKSKEASEAAASVQRSQSAISTNRSRAEQEMVDLRSQLSSHVLALEAMQAELDAARAVAREVEHIKGLSSQNVEKLTKQLEDAQRDARDARERVNMAAARCEELEGELAARDEELADRVARMAKLEKQLKDMDALNQQVLDHELAAQRATTQAAAAAAELEKANASLEEQRLALESAHAAIAEKDRKYGLLQAEAKDKEAALAAAEKLLQERDERLLEQQRAETAARVAVADMKTELRTAEMARQDLKRDLDAARVEAAHLSSEVTRLQNEAVVTTRRLQVLQEDLELARAPYTQDHETRRRLNETLDELAAERASHDATKRALKREAVAVAAAAAATPVALSIGAAATPELQPEAAMTAMHDDAAHVEDGMAALHPGADSQEREAEEAGHAVGVPPTVVGFGDGEGAVAALEQQLEQPQQQTAEDVEFEPVKQLEEEVVAGAAEVEEAPVAAEDEVEQAAAPAGGQHVAVAAAQEHHDEEELPAQHDYVQAAEPATGEEAQAPATSLPADVHDPAPEMVPKEEQPSAAEYAGAPPPAADESGAPEAAEADDADEDDQ